MKILFSELRRIQARMGSPFRRGDCHRAIVDGNRRPPVFYPSGKFEPLEIRETVDFIAEWGEDPDTHKPKLVWVLRGRFEIVLDLPLTRKKSVLP